MALVGYARVSTSDQDAALQTDALNAAQCVKIFSDTASGANTARPQLEAAISYVRRGDTLVVWKLDRLGRSMRHLVEVIDGLGKREVGFQSLTEAIDTSTSAGQLLFHMMGALAQFERDLIRERTRAGLRAAAARGRKGGRPTVATHALLEKARALTEMGLSMREAAGRLRVSKTTLYSAFALAAIDDGRSRNRKKTK